MLEENGYVRKIKSILTHKEIVQVILLVMIMCMSVRWIILDKREFQLMSYLKVFMISLLTGCIGITAISILAMKYHALLRVETLFLIMFLTFGLLYLYIDPLSSTPDEMEHMLRAYGISQGDFIAQTDELGEGGSYVPDNLIYGWKRGETTLKDMCANLSMDASEDRIFMTYSNTALYSPLTYLPQALGILTARLLCNKPYVWAYTGRIFNLIIIGLLIYLAIEISPVGKHIILVLSLLPMNMYECATLSGGGLAYASTILLISYALWFRYKKQSEAGKKEILYLYLLLLLVSSCKIVYAPFVLVAFAIPKERFGNSRKYMFHIICASIMILIASVGWVSIASRYLIEYNEGVDSIAQVKYILHRPLNYVQTIFNTIMYSGEWIIKTFFAGSLGYFDVGVNILVIILSLANTIYVASCEKLAFIKGTYVKNTFVLPEMLILGAVLLTVFGIFTSEYIQWTPYGYNNIEGLQGRYFLPVIFPLLLLVKKKCVTAAEDHNGQRVGDRSYNGNLSCNLILIGLVNLQTIITLLVHYI